MAILTPTEMELNALLFRVAFHGLQACYLTTLMRNTGLLLTELRYADDADRIRAARMVLATIE